MKHFLIKLTYSSMFIIAAFFLSLSMSSMAAHHAVDDAKNDKPSHGKYKSHHHNKHIKRFQKMDANGDNKVDREEYMANAASRFDKLDADGDGFVTEKEAREQHKAMRKKHREKRKKYKEKTKEHREAIKKHH